MSLAQVVHNMSTDREFATLWQRSPEVALEVSGYQLSQEEMAFLSTGLKNGKVGADKSVRLSDLALIHRGWM